MGIQGAMSLMEEDPRRFGRPWKCNWGDANSKKDPPTTDADSTSSDDKEDSRAMKTDIPLMQEEPFVLLVDGMSLLYHVTVKQGTSVVHGSPADIKTNMCRFVSLLLEAIPPFSELRIFMDGLAPKAKLSTQIDRLRNQAIRGDALDQQLKNNGNNSHVKATKNAKLLPLLAEWAMIEAIEDLCSLSEARIALNGKILSLHRPSRGEAEAYIDFWIGTRVKPNTKVHILADDTDFLVYPNCRGFISFKSLEIHEDTGTVRLSGFEYLRQKFLDAFLPTGAVANEDAMPVVAALAGCDYGVKPEAQRVLVQAENQIVKSDIAGLRQKARNNPTKAQRLTATLRFVAHFMERDPDNWVDSLCKAAATPSKEKESNGRKSINGSSADNNNTSTTKGDNMDVDKEPEARFAAILKEAFLSVRKAYFRTLTPPSNKTYENQPCSVEIRRLLEYGIFYCRPIIESWEPGANSPDNNPRKRNLEEKSTASPTASGMDTAATFCAAVISPPFTRQIRSWIEQDSIWLMPHFCQTRLRLYCLLVQFAKTGGAYSFEGGQLRLSPMWTNENPKVSEYVRSNNNGGINANGESSLQMQERDMDILSYDYISTGWGDAGELLTGDDAVDSACLFCILGNIKQAKPALNSCLRGSGIVFLTTLFLPYNLALVIILIGTLPPSLEKVNMDLVDEASRNEMDRVLPFISVACHHAILISNTIRSLYGAQSDEQKLSNLTSKVEGRDTGFRVSDILRHDAAVWIWNAIRSGPDLEELQSDDSDDTEEMKFALKYMDDAIERLGSNVPHTKEWMEKMKSWKSRAKVMWVIWWDVFNVALSTTDSYEMNEWDKYILLLSRS